MTVTADDLDAAITRVMDTLRPATGEDWSAQAGQVEWDCWHTAEHIGDCLLSYAAQLVVQPDGRYVRFLATVDKDASAAEALEFAETGGRILASTVRTAAPGTRAYHPTGMADPEGFAGMGCVEVLLHGQDIAQGLDVTFDPPRELCARLLTRMFPHHDRENPGDPWDELLWSTGRTELPGRARLARWRWRAEPV